MSDQKIVTLHLPESLFKLIELFGSRFFQPAPDDPARFIGTAEFALPVCRLLTDSDEQNAEDLLKMVEEAYAEYSALGDVPDFDVVKPLP